MLGNSKKPHCADHELCCLWNSASGILHLYPIDEAMHKKMCEEIENQKRVLAED